MFACSRERERERERESEREKERERERERDGEMHITQLLLSTPTDVYVAVTSSRIVQSA